VSTIDNLSAAQLTTTSFSRLRDEIGDERFGRLLDGFRQDRGWGDCYGHVLVATGRGDVMVDPVMNVWDCAALKPIVEEAGGRFTDLKGNATIHGGSAVSSNGVLHDQTLALLQGRA
jgi:fructose-1,6-bisphosphatase/inositol monophosphatase family enzyme